MASRPHDDEELSISLSPSQIRRNTRDSNNRAPDPRQHQSLDAAMHSTIAGNGNGAPHHHLGKGRADSRLEQYNIIKTLGEGSFGKVKLAVHKGTGQQVALKIIPRKKLISRDMAGRVEREIEYLQLLRHPHIIKL
jgi:carbon catabolite-derepressing protein kinase